MFLYFQFTFSSKEIEIINPFGMVLPGRNYAVAGADYRYGFNDKEKDDELKGEGNSYDYGARMYDPRLGRWMSTDKHQGSYPSLSPYQFAFNSPNAFNDPDGNDGRLIIIPNSSGGGKIIYETQVHIFGGNTALEVLAQSLNEGLKNVLGMNGEFEDASGKKWTIEINIVYTHENNKAISDLVGDIGPDGSGLLNETKYANLHNDLQSQLKNFRDGDNILFIPTTLPRGLGGTTLNSYSARARADEFSTNVHEIGHLMGFPHVDPLQASSNLYKDMTDIMTDSQSGSETNLIDFLMFHPVHYEEIFSIIEQLGIKLNKKSETVVKKDKLKPSKDKKSDDAKKAEQKPHKVNKKKTSKGKPQHTNKNHYKKNKTSKK